MSSMIPMGVEDADAYDSYAKECGAGLLKGRVDQPDGGQELDARDGEGLPQFFHDRLID